MRVLTTGADEAGRSHVLEEQMFEGTGPELGAHRIYASRREQPLGPRPEGEMKDLGVADGETAWSAVSWPPNAESSFHHTDTIDLDTVLVGSITMGLDDGEHLLGAGDVVVMNGVRHWWRAGPEGCILSVVALGRARAD
jgi:quercetin dioxygenase-like cupin family protein